MRNRTSFALALLALCAAAGDAVPWHHPLYLARDGYWRKRIAITIVNDGRRAAAGQAVRVRIGRGPGEADLEGARAEAVRLCTAEGVELLFRITDASGRLVARGPIPAGASLTAPAECAAGAPARCYLYFDNQAAWQVPDFLAARGELVNGGVEEGEGAEPFGWRHDPADETRRAEWVAENPHAGARCLKTVVAAGAPQSWVATRQLDIAIVGGAEYVMRAWVKARDVEGYAGWYIHVGNARDAMLIAPMLSGGGGTYDWKEVTAAFTAPPDADAADLGTVLWGTGTAWFDDVTLTTTTPPVLRAAAGAVEACTLREVDAPASAPGGSGASDIHMRVRAFNFTDTPLRNALVHADAARLGPYGRDDVLLCEADIPARTVVTLRCGAGDPGIAARWEALLAGAHNLAANPSFETGGGWTAGDAPPGVRIAVVDGGRFGTRCGMIDYPATRAPAWTGWRQDVAAVPGATYFYGAWARCENVKDGAIVIHAHALTKDGGLSKRQAFFSAGTPLSGTCAWTLLSGFVTMPDDAAVLQIHLTMLATGRVFHDGAIVARVIAGAAGEIEAPPLEKLAVWPVNPLVKVFPDTHPDGRGADARVELARNEKEPLQLAVRGPVAVRGMTVTARIARDERTGGPAVAAVNLVGYVPIDCPTNYYRTETPAWQRKIPRESAGSDGWAGMWPDPLLPAAAFDLEAEATRAVWITIAAPNDCAAGRYRGTVSFRAGERVLADVPFDILVRSFGLPEERHVGAIYDVRLGGEWARPGKSAREVRDGFWRFLAERRLCADRIAPDPRIAWRNGQVAADFDEYDEAADVFFNVCKFPFSYTPQVFYLFGWGHVPADRFGEKPYEGAYPYDGVDRRKLRPAYVKAYQECLGAYWRHVKAKGWDKKIVLYISDEPFDAQQPIREQMQALCDMIRGVDPAIPIYSSTWHHQAAWDGYITVWGLGHYGVVPPESLARIESRPSRVWFTTDGQMCTDTPFLAVERLLPHYCFRYGAEAYEFWGCTWLTYDPFQFGWHGFIHQSESPGQSIWVRYPNGDGYLAYPGARIGHDGPVSSIRLEQAREGVEDYEYLHLLAELNRAARAKTGAGDPAAARALENAAALVPVPNAGGRYSTKILPRPDKVFEVRREVAEAIEKMRGR